MKYLAGKLVLAGDINVSGEVDLAGGECIPGVLIHIPREELRAAPTLPMYETLALVPISELYDLVR